MDGMEIFKQDVCRAALECNANLVVVYNGKKAFWYYEQLQALVVEYPNKSITLLEFFVLQQKKLVINVPKKRLNVLSVLLREMYQEKKPSQNIKIKRKK